MREPFRTFYFTLIANQHPQDGLWHYNVNFRSEAIYIGSNNHHITLLANVPGWHVTINGDHSGQVAGGFDELMRLRWDVTPEIHRALDWFRDHRVDM